jgi:DHA2 family methylenomycin A resistance protein-like MFS transporter
MAVLLDHAPDRRAGTASGLFNSSRQIGGALAIAVFGGLLTDPDTFLDGVRTSLLIAAGIVALATAASLLLRAPRTSPSVTNPSVTNPVPAKETS